MSQKDCLAARNEPRHLLTCRACRTEARVAQAWKGLRRPEELEAPIEAGSRFTDEVLASVRVDRVRRRRLRLALAAAAALLFFFFAGTGHETANPSAVATDQSYASLVSPNALEGLIPN